MTEVPELVSLRVDLQELVIGNRETRATVVLISTEGESNRAIGTGDVRMFREETLQAMRDLILLVEKDAADYIYDPDLLLPTAREYPT